MSKVLLNKERKDDLINKLAENSADKTAMYGDPFDFHLLNRPRNVRMDPVVENIPQGLNMGSEDEKKIFEFARKHLPVIFEKYVGLEDELTADVFEEAPEFIAFYYDLLNSLGRTRIRFYFGKEARGLDYIKFWRELDNMASEIDGFDYHKWHQAFYNNIPECEDTSHAPGEEPKEVNPVFFPGLGGY